MRRLSESTWRTTEMAQRSIRRFPPNARARDGAHIIPVGHRSYDRPFDIRVAWGDMTGTDIKKDEFFAVIDPSFLLKTAEDLSRVSLKAGDDAKRVLVE